MEQGISLTALKAACRRLGVPKWPYLRAHCVEQQTNVKNASDDLLAFFDVKRSSSPSPSGGQVAASTTMVAPEGGRKQSMRVAVADFSFGLNTLELDSLLQEALCHVESR